MTWQHVLGVGVNVAFWGQFAVWCAVYLFGWKSHEDLDDWADRIGLPAFEVTLLRTQETRGRHKAASAATGLLDEEKVSCEHSTPYIAHYHSHAPTLYP